MDLIILGSGSPLPDANRAGPSTLVRAGGKDFLFDCGRGVLMRGAAVGMPAQGLAALLVTHMHSDHTTDYNDVITTRWISSMQENPLTVYGPKGFQDFTAATLAMLKNDISYRIAHHADLNAPPKVNVREVERGLIVEADGVRILAAPTDHSPVHPTVGYRVEHGGKAIAIAGDTIPCAGLDEICAGADIYVQTVIRGDFIARAPIQRLRDVHDYHSTVEQAGQTAAKAGVKILVLNHMVPAPPPGTEGQWIEQAAAHFRGEIHVAQDLFKLSV